jgi:glycosyltransferase involved in cell wall biosynthesis
MKIAILLSCYSFEGFFGGVFGLDAESYLKSYRNDFSWDYARGLANIGISTTLYLPSWQQVDLRLVEERIQVRFLPLRRWWRLWDRLPWLSRTPIGRYVAEVTNTLAFWQNLRHALAADEIDILYVQDYWTGRFDVLTRLADKPLIGADHGGRRTQQITLFKRKSFMKAAALTCQTKDETHQVEQFGAKPILLPNGIDTEFFYPDPGVAKEKSILTVARLMDHQKRMSDLIRALALLPPQYRLMIAGIGPDEAMLRSLAADLGVQDRITFLGFITDKSELKALYLKCGVFALPSAYEGLPLVLLEAMACGCSVVVSDIRAFDGLVFNGVNGVVLPVGAVAQLAAGIEHAFEKQDEYALAARYVVEKSFSKKLMLSRLSEVFSECLR